MKNPSTVGAVVLVAVVALLAGCGSSKTTAAPTQSAVSTSAVAPIIGSAAPQSAPAASAAPASSPAASGSTAASAAVPASAAASESPGAQASPAADPGAASAGDPSKGAYIATGPLLADDGFRPATNAFSFENYGPVPTGGTNMIAADIQKIFGDGVCADAKAGKCDLIPEAQNWMDKENASMGGGHCYGFAVAAQLLWRGNGVKPADFGADTAPALKALDNDALQRQIATNWAYQDLASVNAGTVKGTPNDLLAKLKASLVPNPTELYILDIYSPTGGHAVTPYAIEDAANGINNILVYDNNWPGVTRAVRVDTNANTWAYIAALNPNSPPEMYKGDATKANMDLNPTMTALATQPCPFCGKVKAPASGLRRAPVGQTADASGEVDDIYLTGSDTSHGHLLITNPAGQHVGYLDGQLVNEIPGAKVIVPKVNESWLVSEEPDYHVPHGVTYTITLNGAGLTAPDLETIGLIGPSSDVEVNKIDLKPGETDTLVAAPDATEMTYTASSAQTPTFEIAASDTQAYYNFTISGQADQPGSTIKLGLPAEAGTLSIDTGTATGTATLDLAMTREDNNGVLTFKHNGVLTFKHNGITLAAGSSATLQFGSWSATGTTIPLVLNQNGTQTTQSLTDTTG